MIVTLLAIFTPSCLWLFVHSHILRTVGFEKDNSIPFEGHRLLVRIDSGYSNQTDTGIHFRVKNLGENRILIRDVKILLKKEEREIETVERLNEVSVASGEEKEIDVKFNIEDRDLSESFGVKWNLSENNRTEILTIWLKKIMI